MPDPLSSTASAAPSHATGPAPLNYDEVRRLMAPLPTHRLHANALAARPHALRRGITGRLRDQAPCAGNHAGGSWAMRMLTWTSSAPCAFSTRREAPAAGRSAGGQPASGALAKDALRLCARMGLLDEDRRCTEAGLQMAQSDANDALRTAAQWLHDSWMTPGEPPWPMLQILARRPGVQRQPRAHGRLRVPAPSGPGRIGNPHPAHPGHAGGGTARIVATDALHRIGAPPPGRLADRHARRRHRGGQRRTATTSCAAPSRPPPGP